MEQQQKRGFVPRFLSNHGSKVGAFLLIFAVLSGVGELNRMQRELNEHRAGVCGTSDQLLTENRRLKESLIGLRERVLDEVSRTDNATPLNKRLKTLFESLH